jgi:CheY-like chemotaxis protein
MIDNIVKVIEAVAHLINSFAWPFVALIAFWWVLPIVRLLLADKSDVSFSGWGLAITAKRESREAIAFAEASKPNDNTLPNLVNFKQSVGKSYAATKWLEHIRIRDTIGKTVLWVDDKPENNAFERAALEALGIKVEFVPSTSAALEMIKGRQYDAVISDMDRPESTRAGYDLLKKIQLLRPDIPFVLYTSSNTPEQEREIREAGAVGATARASDLIRLVTNAIVERSSGAAQWKNFRNFLGHPSK